MFGLLMVAICLAVAFCGFKLGSAYGFDTALDVFEDALNPDEYKMVGAALQRRAIEKGLIKPKDDGDD